MYDESYADLKYHAKEHKYVWFTEPYDLNVIGIRRNTVIPNKFDDMIYIAYRDALANERVFGIPATTDPGLFYLKNPCNTAGCAILIPGQYLGMWKLGLHRGKYKALVQVKPVTVARDWNRDSVLDVKSAKKQTGLFGINFHYASAATIMKEVANASAGCQVTPVKEDHDYAMALVHLQLRHIKTDVVSYTLYDEEEL